MKRLACIALIVLLGAGASGCRKLDVGSPSCSPYPACSGVQEAGVVLRNTAVANPGGSSAACRLRLRPLVRYSRPSDGRTGRPRTPSGDYDRAPSAGTNWCRSVHQGAGYVIFWASTTLYFTQYGNVTAGSAVKAVPETTQAYCFIDFYEPKAQDLIAAGPFPRQYCTQIVPSYRLRPAPSTGTTVQADKGDKK
jgi:hypothetical protein